MRRALRILFKTLLGLVSVVVLVYFLRGPLFGRAIANYVAEQLGAELGGKFTIHKIEGDWIRDFAVVGLRTEEPPPTGALTRLEWGRATVMFDLFELIDGNVEAAVKGIRVSNGNIELDLTRPEEPEEPDAVHPLDALPASLPELNLASALKLRTEDAEYVLELAVAGRDDVFDVEIGGIEFPDVPELERFYGRLRRESARSFLVSSEKEVEGVLIRSIAVHLPDEGWRIDAALGAAGGDIAVQASAAGLAASLRGLDLKRLPRVESPVSGRIDTGTVTTRDWSEIGFAAALSDLRHEELRFDEVAVEGKWRDGRAALARVQAASASARVRATGLVVDPALPYFVASLEQARVEIPDLRAFVDGLEHEVSVETDVLSVRGRQVEVPSVAVRAPGATLQLTFAATLAEDPQAWRSTRFVAELDGRFGDVNRFAADLPRIEGEVTVTGRAEGTLDEPVATLAAAGSKLVVDGRAVEAVSLKGRLDWPRLEGFQFALDADAGRVALRGDADLERRTVRDAAFDVDIKDLGGIAALFPGLPKVAGRLQGSGEVVWDGERAVGRGTLAGQDLAYEGFAVGSLDADAAIQGEEISFQRLESRGTWGWARGRGWVHLKNRTARAEALEGVYDKWPVRLTRPLDAEWGEQGVSLTGLDVAALGGRIHGDVRLAERVEARLTGTNLHLDEVDARLKGRANALVVVSGDDYELELDAPQVSFEGQAGRLRLKARQDPRGIDVAEIEAHLGQALTVSGTAVVPYRFEKDRFVRVDGRPPRVFLDAKVRDVARFTGLEAAEASVRLEGDAAGLKGEVRARDLALHEGLVLKGDTAVRLEASPAGVSAAVESAPGNLGQFAGEASLDRGVDWTRPESLEALFQEARVQGAVTVEAPDLSVLKDLFEEVRAAAGRASVRLEVSGPLRAPEVHGTARVDDVTCFVEGDLPPVQDVSGGLRFDGRTVHVERLAGRLGYEPVEVVGTLSFPPGAAPAFDLQVKGTNVQLVRDRYLRLRADVDVKLAGPLDALLVAGKVRVTDGLYSRPVDFLAKSGAAADSKFQLFSVREGPFRRMKLDVEITGDESFRVRNNLVRGAFSVDLRLGGTGEVPQPVGRISCRDVLVRLPAASLKIDQGELRFPVENPFVPVLNVAGHTRKRGYDINVQVSGEMPDFLVVVSSNPSLSQEDAILLLTAGATRADLEQEGIERAALSRVGAYFGERLVSRVSGPEDPDEASFLDRFQFEIGSNVTRSGQETIAGEFEITRKWYLRGERDRFDDYNAGIVWRLRFR